MARARKRNTSWEPADGTVNISTVNTTAGFELLTAGQVGTWGPGTMVRLRGVVYAQLNQTADGSNEPGLIMLQIRKVSLEATDSTFVATTERLDAGPNLANEDILWTGGILMSASLVFGTFSIRPAGFVDVDVKAKRRFESGEERLVLEAMAASGDGATVKITSCLRALIMF